MNRLLDYDRDVKPRLSAEVVYREVKWTRRMDRAWGYEGQCPIHDDSDPRSRRFRVNPQTLRYKCHSCQASGSALQWIAGHGNRITAETFHRARQIAGLAGLEAILKPRAPSLRQTSTSARKTTDRESASGKLDEKAAMLWKASEPADGTAAAQYLGNRLIWPIVPNLQGWDVPQFVKWISRRSLHKVLRWMLPRQAAGCIVFGYSPPGCARPRAVKLEALTSAGARVAPRWRRNIGTVTGLLFHACDMGSGEIHVGEGEVTALALAVACRARGKGAAVATGGAAGLISGATAISDLGKRPVRIHADRDPAGRDAAWKLEKELQATGYDAMAIGLEDTASDSSDAADFLAAKIRARLEDIGLDRRLSRREAVCRAWAEVLGQRLDNTKKD